jgi:hypothetical protein
VSTSTQDERTIGTNGFAIASLVLGVLGLLTVGLLSVLALVLGYAGRREIDRSGGAQSGRGLALAGITLGWVGVALFAIVVLGLIAFGVGSGSVGSD